MTHHCLPLPILHVSALHQTDKQVMTELHRCRLPHYWWLTLSLPLVWPFSPLPQILGPVFLRPRAPLPGLSSNRHFGVLSTHTCRSRCAGYACSHSITRESKVALITRESKVALCRTGDGPPQAVAAAFWGSHLSLPLIQ